MNFKLAAYLDEAGNGLTEACRTLCENNIKGCILRYTWSGKNICNTNDANLRSIRSALDDNNIHVVAIQSFDNHNRALDLSMYFNADMVIITGINPNYKDIELTAITYNITPCLSMNGLEPVHLANIFNQYRTWRYLYDPADIVSKKNVDPFIKYWTLLKNNVQAIDIRDYKTNRGPKIPFSGDCRLKDTLADCESLKIKPWIFIEPGIGHRYGSTHGKKEIFNLAFQEFRKNT